MDVVQGTHRVDITGVSAAAAVEYIERINASLTLIEERFSKQGSKISWSRKRKAPSSRSIVPPDGKEYYFDTGDSKYHCGLDIAYTPTLGSRLVNPTPGSDFERLVDYLTNSTGGGKKRIQNLFALFPHTNFGDLLTNHPELKDVKFKIRRPGIAGGPGGKPKVGEIRCERDMYTGHVSIYEITNITTPPSGPGSNTSDIQEKTKTHFDS